MRKVIGLLLSAGLLPVASCTVGEFPPGAVFNGDALNKTLLYEVSGYDEGTKGMLDGVAEKVGDMNIMVYDASGALVPACSGYEKSMTSITFPEKGTYTVYVLANAGNLSDCYPEEQSGMETFGFEVPDYEQMAECGLPMAGSVSVDTEYDESVKINLQRLFTKLSVRFDKEYVEEEYYDKTFVKSVGIRQAAKEIFPFNPAGSMATVATRESEWADRADDDDVVRVNSGGVVTLYVPTNMQGVLLDEDNPQRDKTPADVEFQGDEYTPYQLPLLTYLEMHCQVEDGSAVYSDVVFRHYIGGSASTGPDNYNCSFNVYPNRTREMTLTLSGGDIIKEVWRLEPYSPQWKECALLLTPLQYPMLAAAPDPDFPGSGASAPLRVLHHQNVSYTVEISGESTDLKYKKTWKSYTEDLVEFYCDTYQDDSYLQPCLEGTFSPEDLDNTMQKITVIFRSTDGTLEKSTEVYCLKSALGCYYTLDADGVTVSVNNKFGLTFDCSLTAAVKSKNGVTSSEGMGANPYKFSVKPVFGKDDIFTEGENCSGYFATGSHIYDIFDVDGDLVGSKANLEISCRELPGLVIKYGAGPLKYHSKEGVGPVENYMPLRMSYPFEGEPYYIGGSGIGKGRRLPDYFEANWLKYYVNGDPDIVIK